MHIYLCFHCTLCLSVKTHREKRVAKMDDVDINWTERVRDGVFEVVANDRQENNHNAIQGSPSTLHSASNHESRLILDDDSSPMEVESNHHHPPDQPPGNETAKKKPFFPGFDDSDDSNTRSAFAHTWDDASLSAHTCTCKLQPQCIMLCFYPCSEVDMGPSLLSQINRVGKWCT